MQGFRKKNKNLSVYGGQSGKKNGILFNRVSNPLRKQRL